jgi:hypothetical protein
MSEYQIMRWREIPSMVIARDGQTQIKISLPARFQEAIDEAAMRLGEIDADAYTSGWIRDPWIEAEGTPDALAAKIVSDIENELTEAAIAALLDTLGNR